MSDRTEHLIEEIVDDLEPVRRIPRLRVVAGGVGLGAVALAAVAVSLLGLRADVRGLSCSASYVGVIAGLTLFAAGGLLAALGASVPGRARPEVAGRLVLGSAALVWTVSGIAMVVQGTPFGVVDRTWLNLALHCLATATAIGAIPALLLVRFVLGAHPRHLSAAVATGAAGMVAFGSLAVHLTCSADAILHVGLAHLAAPLALGALLGALLPRLPHLHHP